MARTALSDGRWESEIASFCPLHPRMKADKGRYRSGQTGRTVNPLAYAFSGSNPLLPSSGTSPTRAPVCHRNVFGFFPGSHRVLSEDLFQYSPNMSPHFRSTTVHGFSLIELLVVVAIVALLAGGTVTMFTSIGQARGVADAASQVASLLEQARSEAVSRNTYVWLSLMPQTNSGSSDLRVGLVFSKDGTTNTRGTNLAPIAKPFLIQHVMLTNYTALAVPPSFPLTPGTADLASSSLSPTFTNGKVIFSGANGARSVTFTPLGEATTNTLVANGFDPRIAIGLRQTRGTAFATNNDVVVMIDGSVGIPITYQRNP